ncbi:hypothetical protein [Deinococcus misasensis]|uniref:hypothetical protein n=1 Tax=Deinococcus misasensis TaxID=392413 RepID=UPI0012FB7049|nr:hypothetical protein [Deinococcus misasensis]
MQRLTSGMSSEKAFSGQPSAVSKKTILRLLAIEKTKTTMESHSDLSSKGRKKTFLTG